MVEKLRFAILIEIEKGNRDFNHSTFGVTEDEFFEAMRDLNKKGYINRIIWVDNTPFNYKMVNITSVGKRYMEECSN